MIGEYVTPALVGGARGLMVVNVIVSQFHALRFGVGSAMVFVLTALALVLMLVLRRRPGTHDHRPMLAFLGPGSAVQCFALHPG